MLSLLTNKKILVFLETKSKYNFANEITCAILNSLKDFPIALNINKIHKPDEQ